MKKKIGEILRSKGKLMLGDVIAIPLNNGTFGYGRIYHESMGILDITSEKLLELKDLFSIKNAFNLQFCEAWTKPTWIYLGCWEFADGENKYGESLYSYWILDDSYTIFESGCKREVRKEDTLLLLSRGLWFPSKVAQLIQKYFEVKARNGIVTKKELRAIHDELKKIMPDEYKE